MKTVDSKNTFDSSNMFIELHRTFHELSNDSGVDDDEALSRVFLSGSEPIGWRDLFKEYRVIILSEAGSGKTTETRNAACTLRAEGKPAFFLRLEHISNDFDVAFDEGTYDEFADWRESGEEGWLFLDSVDEARLRHPRDFERAIRRLSSRIETAKDRTHIVITTRPPPAWRPKTDLDLCNKHLPFGAQATSVSVFQADDDSSGSVRTKTKENKDRRGFKIVAFDDLNREQIAEFVKARDVEDSEAFVDAVERAEAESFTSRPQDLQELAELWKDEGRIGTRLELIRNSIDRRLAERDQDRAVAHPLPTGRAREGARLLAAAATLVKNPDMRIPDGGEYSKGIAVHSVLPDWDDKEHSTLLSRPIFDEAIYGAVRFHTRSVREYLTAEWFAELLKRGTSRRVIEALFFRNQYGLDVIVPALRPILPWLAILDEKVMERARQVEPGIIFEGGDPSQLPLNVRRDTLQEVCEEMARGTTDRSLHDYTAVLRFANPDLTDDVRALIRQYAHNADLTAFLLRMVWIGELSGALPEAMEYALSPTAENYVRAVAFRALNAIGSEEDKERVRQSFLAESTELNRVWLAELVEGVSREGDSPTEQNLVWLLACLEKSEPKKPYSVDGLQHRVTELASRADLELLPQLIAGLNRLLSLPPMIERWYCEVSEKFKWLMAPASRAVERLIEARHPASLEPDALGVLHKFSAARDYEGMTGIGTEFSELVPAWREFNRALFWFEAQKSRETLDKKSGERLTEFRRVSIFGSLWQFKVSDFEYVAGEISCQAELDDRLVALSLAFDLYKRAKRPRPWREKLKVLTAGQDELSGRLRTYLRPPAQSKESRRWKQEESEWKKRVEAEKRVQEEHHARWKKNLTDDLDDIRAKHHEDPGTLTNALLYLFDQTRDKESISGRWTEYNWKTLISGYGEEAARFYRDATVAFWRHHTPTLRSEGAPLNKTTYAVIIGLVGLEIEATEVEDWPMNLSAAEVERACRYASFELNGFPTWFPKLFEAYPNIVGDFLVQEVRYELSIEKPDNEIHYVLSDLSWSGQWAWDQIAPTIYELLKKEPKNLSNLDKLQKILQGSSLPDDQIEKLASRKCRTLKKLEHAAPWFAVWTGVAPEPAIAALQAKIAEMAGSEARTLFAMIFVSHLVQTRYGEGGAARQAFKTPEHLKSLYLLMHDHIQRQEDINRAESGAFTPGLRDFAQEARTSLFNLLDEIRGKEAFLALMEIAEMHPDEASRPWMLVRAKARAQQDAEIGPWSPSQVREFHKNQELTPRNHRELAELAVLRLQDLKDDLEHGDSSIANILIPVKKETDMRTFIGWELRGKSFGRYSIPQEEELADAKRPDLRFHRADIDGPVPVELKLADNWTGPELIERLENQLAGDYLRDNRSSRGIYLLVYRGEKRRWKVPGGRVDFAGLTAALQDHWWRIAPKISNVDDITVIGIDLTKRSS